MNDTPIRAAATILVAFAVGLAWPDLDFHLPLVDHRSALTHSVLVVLLLWWRMPLVAGGLAIGIGVHLMADAFPNAMRGYATIKLPFAGSIGPQASYLWLVGNALVGVALGLVIVRRHVPGAAAPLLALIAVGGLVYLATTDGGWWALSAIAALGALWARLRRRLG